MPGNEPGILNSEPSDRLASAKMLAAVIPGEGAATRIERPIAVRAVVIPAARPRLQRRAIHRSRLLINIGGAIIDPARRRWRRVIAVIIVIPARRGRGAGKCCAGNHADRETGNAGGKCVTATMVVVSAMPFLSRGAAGDSKSCNRCGARNRYKFRKLVHGLSFRPCARSDRDVMTKIRSSKLNAV